MFTALMSIALVVIVVAATVQYSLTMDEMLSHGAAPSGKPVASTPEAGMAARAVATAR